MATLNTKVLKGVWERAQRSAVLYGSAATAVRVGANILLLPLVLKVLPTPELAVWYVFLALGGIANLADFGFGAAFTRVYSFWWAGAEDFETTGLGPPPQNQAPNRSRIRQFHSVVRKAYLRIALLGMGVLIVAGAVFLTRPFTAVANPALGWSCWAAFILTIGFSLGTSHWILACQGIDRVRDLQAAHLASGIVYVVAAALLLISGWGLFAMVAATAARALVVRHMCRRAYLRAVPEESTPAMEDVRSTLERIWPNARRFGLLSLGGYLTLNANVLICSHVLGSDLTASYGLTTQVGNFIMSFSALWLVVKWPQITILRTQGRLQDMGVLFARRLAIVMASFGAMGAVLVLAGNALLEWKGAQTRFLPAGCLLVFLVNLFQQQFYMQFGMLTFTENVVPFVKLSIVSGIATVALSGLLAWQFGLWGLISAPLIVTASSCLWYVTCRGFHGQPLNVRQFARAAVLGHV